MEEKDFKKFNATLDKPPSTTVGKSTGTKELMSMFRMGV